MGGLNFLKIYFFNMCICPYICVGTSRGQKKVLGILELEIQVVVNCHVGARN